MNVNVGNSRGSSSRLIIGIVMVVFALVSYFASSQYNDITGEKQYLSLTPDQEIALGLQAVPEIIQEYGGELPDQQTQNRIDQIGNTIVNNSVAKGTPWKFDFHVLRDDQTVNAFALPGGQVFITEGLLARLSTDDEIAGVLSHEIVHVLARHSAQQIAKSDLTNGLVGAVAVASNSASAAQTAAMVAQLVNLKYGRGDESQSDEIGVCLMISAGYDPNGMLEVMRILQEVSGGSSQPEFMSTHPDPANRLVKIQEAIDNAATDCPK